MANANVFLRDEVEFKSKIDKPKKGTNAMNSELDILFRYILDQPSSALREAGIYEDRLAGGEILVDSRILEKHENMEAIKLWFPPANCRGIRIIQEIRTGRLRAFGQRQAVSMKQNDGLFPSGLMSLKFFFPGTIWKKKRGPHQLAGLSLSEFYFPVLFFKDHTRKIDFVTLDEIDEKIVLLN